MRLPSNSTAIVVGNRLSMVVFSKKITQRTIRRVVKSMTFLDPNYKSYLIWGIKNKRRRWDGKVRFLTPVAGEKYKYQFPTGLLSLALDSLVEADISFYMTGHKDYNHAKPSVLPKCSADVLEGAELRPYQMKAVDELLRSCRGVCRVGTGGGKTEIICVLAKILAEHGNKVLILTHRTELFKNLINRLSQRGVTGVSSYGGSISDLSGNVIVASIPKLWKNIKDPAVQEVLSTTQVLIGDEVHHAQSADSWYKIMLSVSAPWRFGFTATTMMADEYKSEELKLRAVTGDVVVDIPAKWLIDNGYLATPRISMVEFSCRSAFLKSGIIDLVRQAMVHGPTLIIVKSLEEGNSITKLLNNVCIRTGFVQGVTSSQDRDEAVRALVAGELAVLVSSVIMKEGVDIPSVKSLINLCDEKKHRSAIQIVGRALRGTGDVFVYDPVFMKDSGAVRRATERMRAYAAEGFEVRRSKRAPVSGDKTT